MPLPALRTLVALGAALILALPAGAQKAAAAKAAAPAPPPQTAVQLKHTHVDTAERGRELVLRTTILASAGAYLPTLYYRPIGEQRFYSLPMLPVPGSVNIFAGAIPGLFVTKDLEYYLESYDTQLRGPGQAGSQKQPLPVMVLDPAAVPSQVAVRSDPADATLEIDGEEVGLTPWRGPLPPGQHELVLKKDGFLESASSLDVPPGRDLDLRLSLTPAAEAAQFAIMSDPAGATVYINSQQLGNTPLIAPSPDGEHTVTLEKQGFARAERKVLFSKDRSIELSFSLQKLPPEPALAVTTDPAGARVFVDEKELGKTPFIGVIGAGEHTLVLKLEGKRTAQAQIVMPEDRDLDLRFTLEDEKENRAPIIAVSSDPADAVVFIDGTEVGKTPFINTLAPGEHKVKLVYPKFYPYEKTIKMPESNDMEVTLALIPEPPPPGPSKITIGAVPNDVEITVDGKVVGTVKGGVPVVLELPAGAHVANARREGFRSVEERFTVVQGEGLTMKLALQPIPKEAVDEPLLSVRSDPEGAVVNIDGQQVGVTPYSATLKGGKHKLTVSMEGFKSRDEAFELPPDKGFELRYSFTLIPVRKSVSLASAADQKKTKESRSAEPVVNMEDVKSAGGPMSGAKYKVYKPGELAKIKAARESEATKNRASAAARRTSGAAPCTQQRCPPIYTSTGRAGPAVLGILGMASALGAGYIAFDSFQRASAIESNIKAENTRPAQSDANSIRSANQVAMGLAGAAAVLGAISGIWGSTASPMTIVKPDEAKEPKEKKKADKAVEKKSEKKPEKKPEPKADEKKPEPKVEEKKPEPKAEEKAPEPKAEEKPPEPKADAPKEGGGGDVGEWLGTLTVGVAPTNGGALVGVVGSF